MAGITAVGRNIGVAIAMDSGTHNFREKWKRIFLGHKKDSTGKKFLL